MDVETLLKIKDTIIELGVQPDVAKFLISVLIISIAFFPIAFLFQKLFSAFGSKQDLEKEKSESERIIWASMKDSIQFHTTELEKTRAENTTLYELIKKLELRIKKLENVEHNFERLKIKLEEKDRIIAEQYKIILEQNVKIQQLENVLLELKKKEQPVLPI